MNQANLMMERAYANGIAPNVYMYTLLMQGFGRLGQPQLAQTVFRRMMKDNVKPDYAAIEALTSAFFFVGAYRTARNVLLDVWPLVQDIPDELPPEAPLRDLIESLRASREPPTLYRVKAIESEEERQRRRELRKAMGSVLQELRRWQKVAHSVAWAKTDFTWDYILQPKNSSTGEGVEGGGWEDL